MDCVPKTEESYATFSIRMSPNKKRKQAQPPRNNKRARCAQFIDDMAAGSEESEEELDMDREETLDDLIGDGAEEEVTGE